MQVRIYSVAIPDLEILTHIQKQILDREELQGYIKLHLKMQDEQGGQSLVDSGPHNFQTTLYGKHNFVSVSIYKRTYNQISKIMLINRNAFVCVWAGGGGRGSSAIFIFSLLSVGQLLKK